MNKSDYQINAESIVRMHKEKSIDVIDRLIRIKSPEEHFHNINTGTSVLEKQHYIAYYKRVKEEIEKLL